MMMMMITVIGDGGGAIGALACAYKRLTRVSIISRNDNGVAVQVTSEVPTLG